MFQMIYKLVFEFLIQVDYDRVSEVLYCKLVFDYVV